MSIESANNEKELLSRIAGGDEIAFKELFSIYIPFLQPTIRKLVKDSAVADDILQEVFMRIWLYRDKLLFVESPRAWVLKIAYNRAFTFRGGQHKYESHLQQIAGLHSDLSRETEDQLAYRALIQLLRDAVKQLPPQQQKIYELSRNNGLSLQEVADTLGISLQTVKNSLGKALQAIRTYIEASGYPLSALLIFLTFF